MSRKNYLLQNNANPMNVVVVLYCCFLLILPSSFYVLIFLFYRNYVWVHLPTCMIWLHITDDSFYLCRAFESFSLVDYIFQDKILRIFLLVYLPIDEYSECIVLLVLHLLTFQMPIYIT